MQILFQEHALLSVCLSVHLNPWSAGREGTVTW